LLEAVADHLSEWTVPIILVDDHEYVSLLAGYGRRVGVCGLVDEILA
jgi:hypothetical protein